WNGTFLGPSVGAANPYLCTVGLGNGFTDGTSNTVLFATGYSQCLATTSTTSSGTTAGTSVRFYTGAPSNTMAGASFFGFVGFNPGTPTTRGNSNPNVASPGTAITALGAATASLANQTCFQIAPPLSSGFNVALCNRPQSFGAGGLSVCMGDVVVRQVAGSIAVDTWSRALHPSDGCPQNSDWN